MRMLCLSVLLAVSAAITPVAAQAIANRYELNIPRQPLDAALKDFAQQTGLQIARFSDAVKAGAMVGPISGRYSLQEALASLLTPQNLGYKVVNDRTIAVVNLEAQTSIGDDQANAAGSNAAIEEGGRWNETRENARNGLAGLRLVSAEAQPQAAPEIPAAAAERNKQSDEAEVVVTGTSLRGIAPESSPVIVFTRKDIEASGHTTVEQFMRTVPQNFNGGVTQENYMVIGTGIATNTQGSGVNLRGLGQRATLILINGRRQAPTGELGDFVDVSVIPLSAVERIEILTNGASAIYGSDAVGGVVNYILREDFDGLETSLMVGSAANGDGDQIQVAQTVGNAWDSGHAMLSYEYRSEDRVTAGDRDFTVGVPADSIFTPQERRNSVFGAVKQSLSSRLSFNGSASYLKRDTQRDTIYFGALTIAEAQNRVRSVGADLLFDINSNWEWQFGGSYSNSDGFTTHKSPPPAPWGNLSHEENQVVEVGSKISGDLFSMAGGAVKVAAGVQLRQEDRMAFFTTLASNFSSTSLSDTDREIHAAFAEMLLPLVTSANRRTGVERLEISLAGRYEDYGSIGDTFDPKIGVMWAPTRSLSLRATYDTSFRAPLLSEATGQYYAYYYPADVLFADPAQATGYPLLLAGFAPGITPETSETWTAGLEFEPESVPGLRFTFNYFSTEYTDRITSPTVNIAVIGDPAFGSIVAFNPALDSVLALLGSAAQVTDATGPGFTPGGRVPADVTVVLDIRLNNTATTNTDGFDVGLDYSFALGAHEFTASTNLTRINGFEAQLTPSSPTNDILNTPFNPIDLRARLGLSWAHQGWNGNVFLNHVGDYEDDRFAPFVKVDAFDTVDLTLGYAFQSQQTLLKNLRLSFNALNVFDEDPPTLRGGLGITEHVGYDSVNASGRGRYVSVQLKKAW